MAEDWLDDLNATHDNAGAVHDIWHGGVTAAELAAMDFPAIKWIVPDFIAEGCTLLAGRPKLGKSWLVLDAGLAVASGGETLGRKCEAGDVLYLALEDNQRRLKSRLRRIWPNGMPMPEQLRLMTEWPSGDEGVAAIDRWIAATPSARLVIVDVLAMIKSPAPPRAMQYEADYGAIRALQSVAMTRNVAIVVVHHTRKSGAENDAFEKVSGTLGLSGAADTTIILDRDGQGCTLYGRGRDVEEFETAVTFDRETCRWQAHGDASEVRRSEQRSVILSLLADNWADYPDGMTPAEVAAALDMVPGNVKQLLFKMAKAGEAIKSVQKKGRYLHPDHAGAPVLPVTPDNSDNRDNPIPVIGYRGYRPLAGSSDWNGFGSQNDTPDIETRA